MFVYIYIYLFTVILKMGKNSERIAKKWLKYLSTMCDKLGNNRQKIVKFRKKWSKLRKKNFLHENFFIPKGNPLFK